MSASHPHCLSRCGGRPPARLDRALLRLAVAGVFALLRLPAGAPEANAPPASGGRYLFIVDTSYSMRGMAEAVARTAEDLVRSGLQGHLRAGDTLGLWTFNERLYAGQFPLQVWSPAQRDRVAAALGAFLRRQRYERKTRLEPVLAEALRLVRESESLTLVLLTDGGEPVRGTPFDDAINAAFRRYRREQQRVRMPLVTVWRAQGGRLVNYVVGQPQWSFSIPPLPAAEPPASPSPVAPETTATAVAATAPPRPEPKGAVTTVPTETGPVQASAPVQTTAAAARPLPEVASASSALPQTQVRPDPGAIAPAPAPSSPAAVESPSPAAQTPLTPPAETPPAGGMPAPATQPAAELERRPAPAAPAQSAPASPGPVAAPSPAPAKPSLPADATPAGLPDASPPPPTAAAGQVAAVAAAPAAAPVPPPPATPPAVAGPPVEPVAPALSLAQGPTPPAPTTAPPTPTPAPGQAAVAVPPQPFLSGARLLLLGLLLAAVAATLLLLWLRRLRQAGRASLITQSFDRDKKP